MRWKQCLQRPCEHARSKSDSDTQRLGQIGNGGRAVDDHPRRRERDDRLSLGEGQRSRSGQNQLRGRLCRSLAAIRLHSGSTAAVAGSGVIAAKLTTLANPEGKGTQVVYAGFPLYYYAKDKAPGDTTGQGVGGTWFVVTPDQAPNA